MTALPSTGRDILDWSWDHFEPHYRELQSRSLSADTVDAFLRDWSRVAELVAELEQRLSVAKTVNTADVQAEQRFNRFLEEVYPPSRSAEQALKEKLLDSGLQPEGFSVPMRNMRAQAELFREANVPLLAVEEKQGAEWDAIVGAQTITWDGQELPLPRLNPFYESPERATRERAWRLAAGRRVEDRERIGRLWVRELENRRTIAANAGLPDYRAFRWRQLLRFDYGPEDNQAFHAAVKEVVAPALSRSLQRRRERLRLDTLRPWDLRVDPLGSQPLRPFEKAAELETGISRMFHALDPELASDFDRMSAAGLLDLESRKNKAPGGYCTSFSAAKEPFIFMNAAGVHNDVQTLMHESGHAFHVFRTAGLPYLQQRSVGHEFAEVASMSMELLAAPHLDRAAGGFYTPAEAARARINHLEGMIGLWVRLMYIDAFQHWVYTHLDEAMDVDACDASWSRLYRDFITEVDWTGLEAELANGWQQVPHIHEVPFYIIEYAMAQLAAVQVWIQAKSDRDAALARYKQALTLGGTRSLPELFAAVGAPFRFDASVLGPAVDAIEAEIDALQEDLAKA